MVTEENYFSPHHWRLTVAGRGESGVLLLPTSWLPRIWPFSLPSLISSGSISSSEDAWLGYGFSLIVGYSASEIWIRVGRALCCQHRKRKCLGCSVRLLSPRDHRVHVKRGRKEKIKFPPTWLGRGHAVEQWLRHYATIQKVADSRPDEVNDFFFQFT
jgi:hypothetical protein